jgi:hypothetical protein
MGPERCGRGSVVEHHLAKVRVAGSNPVARSDKGAGQGPFSGPRLAWGRSPCSGRAAYVQQDLLHGDNSGPGRPALGEKAVSEWTLGASLFSGWLQPWQEPYSIIGSRLDG